MRLGTNQTLHMPASFKPSDVHSLLYLRLATTDLVAYPLPLVISVIWMFWPGSRTGKKDSVYYKWTPLGTISTPLVLISYHTVLDGPYIPLVMLPMTLEDAFQILDLSERVTPDEIKNAYRIMVVVPLRPYFLQDTFSWRCRLWSGTQTAIMIFTTRIGQGCTSYRYVIDLIAFSGPLELPYAL